MGACGLIARVKFPSCTGREFLAALRRAPLGYSVTRQAGSHRRLSSANGYPDIGFSWHDGETLPGSLLRRYLMNEVGLTEDEALAILRR